jgi:oligopeptide/dipeptide ABC transporter ATP-binding protein
MYAGEIVETGSTDEVLRRPAHPYTRALLRSLPESAAPGEPLSSISGTVPSLLHPPAGCRFRERCEMSTGQCAEPPPLTALPGTSARAAACWFAELSWAAGGAPGTVAPGTVAPRAVAPDAVVGAAVGAAVEMRDTTTGSAAADAAPVLVEIAGVDVRFGVGKDRARLERRRSRHSPR